MNGDLRNLAVGSVALLVVVMIVFPDRFFGPEPIPARKLSEPIVVEVGGEKRAFRVEAMRDFGATPLVDICGVKRPDEADMTRALACADPPSLAPAAGHRLAQAENLEGDERLAAIRDANGLTLEALGRPVHAGGDAWGGMSGLYARLSEAMGDLRLFDIAAEVAEIEAATCDRAKEPSCATDALEPVGEDLTEAGRKANDFKRLVRAAELLRQAVDNAPKDYHAQSRAELIEDLGSAYNYASHFEPEGHKLKWLNLAIAAGEENMAFADANAPSFTSARIWSNLGAVYASRGGDQTGSADFRKAIELYDRALGYFKKDEDAEGYAKTTQNRAGARSALASEAKDLALHDQAIMDHEASIAVFDEGKDEFDAAYGRFRLARALAGRARTADALRRVGDVPETRKAELSTIARDSVAAGLAALASAEPPLRRSGSAHYLGNLEEERRSLVTLQESLAKSPG